jgi:predicted dinucleotide-binding enzyme
MAMRHCRAEALLTGLVALGVGLSARAWRAAALAQTTEVRAATREQKTDARAAAQEQQTAWRAEGQEPKAAARAAAVILEVMATDKHTNKPAAGLS